MQRHVTVCNISNMDGKSKKVNTLDRVFLRRFWCCIKIIFPACSSTTFLLFVLLLGLSLAEQILIYNTGLIPSQFYEVLSSRDKQGFQSLIILALGLIIGTALGKSLVQYVSNFSYVKWRGLLTYFLHKHYFKNDSFYNLNVLDRSIDNPDQRVTQDVDRFCQQFQKIVQGLIISPFTIAYYTYQCHTSAGYLGPLSIYGYFIVGTIVNKLIMSPIIALVIKQERLEGDFRFKHMQVRVNSESLAFYQSGSLEEKRTNKKLNTLLDVQQKLVNYNFFLNFSVNFIDYVGAILSYFIIAIALFGGKYDGLSTSALTGEISKNSFVSMYLISSFTSLIDLSNAVSDMAGYTHRIGELIENLKEHSLEKHEQRISNDEPLVVLNNDFIFQFVSLCYGAPKSLNPLVSNLNLTIKVGENILITGKTGSGKSSLLRVLSDLWKPLSGKVHKNLKMTPNNVLFLPQRALLSDGTLKQQVIYPFDTPFQQEYKDIGEENDDDILQILNDVGLSNVCKRFGGINDVADGSWEDMLSPGEMQRVAFARLFYHKPVIALLDEATSALDVPSERSMYEMCGGLGITLVSIGHRESLASYHHVNLRLDGEGGWTLSRIKPN